MYFLLCTYLEALTGLQVPKSKCATQRCNVPVSAAMTTNQNLFAERINKAFELKQ